MADFTTFMYSFLVLLHEHHANEEKYFFPMFEDHIGTPGWMEKNVEQHHAFSLGLVGFEDFVKTLQSGNAGYDGTKVRKLVDDFAPILIERLSDEIGTLEDLEKYGDKIDWKTRNKKVGEIAVKTADTNHEITVVLMTVDILFEKPIHEAVWPPFPWFAAHIFR